MPNEIEPVTLREHSSVNALCALGEGHFASGSADNTIKIWESTTGTCLRTLTGHSDWVSALCALGEGHFASGSADKTIKIWESKTGTCLRTLTGHSNSVNALCALGEGHFASGSWDDTIKIWESKTGTCLRTLAGHNDWVYALCALGEGHFASGSVDNTIKIWDSPFWLTNLLEQALHQAINGTSKGTFTALSPLYPGATFEESQKTDLANIVFNRLKRYKLPVYQFTEEPAWIWHLSAALQGLLILKRKLFGKDTVILRTSSMELSQDKDLISAIDGAIQDYQSHLLCQGIAVAGDIAPQLPRQDLTPSPKPEAIETDKKPLQRQDHAILAKESMSRALPIEETRLRTEHEFFTGEITPDTLGDHLGIVNALCALGEGHFAGSRDGTIKIWESKTGTCLRTLIGRHSNYVLALCALGEGLLASGSGDGTIKIWESKTGTCLRTLIGWHSSYVLALCALGEGHFASGSGDKTIKIWESKTGTCLRTLTGHSNSVTALCALGEGYFASGSDDKTIKIWESKTGRCLRTLTGHSNLVRALCALGEGHFASGSADMTIKIWESKTGACFRTLTGHSNVVLALCALGEGHFASGSVDKTIKIWESKTGTCLHTLPGHNDWVRALCALGEDHFASGSGDKTIKIWHLSGHGKHVAPAQVSEEVQSSTSDNIRVFFETLRDARQSDSALIALLEAGFDKESQWEDSGTPLLAAVAENRTALARWLIQHKAKLEASNRHGWTALHVAVEKNHLGLLQQLVEVCEPEVLLQENEEKETPFHIAVRKGHKAALNLLLEKNPKGYHLKTLSGDLIPTVEEAFASPPPQQEAATQEGESNETLKDERPIDVLEKPSIESLPHIASPKETNKWLAIKEKSILETFDSAISASQATIQAMQNQTPAMLLQEAMHYKVLLLDYQAQLEALEEKLAQGLPEEEINWQQLKQHMAEKEKEQEAKEEQALLLAEPKLKAYYLMFRTRFNALYQAATVILSGKVDLSDSLINHAINLLDCLALPGMGLMSSATNAVLKRQTIKEELLPLIRLAPDAVEMALWIEQLARSLCLHQRTLIKKDLEKPEVQGFIHRAKALMQKIKQLAKDCVDKWGLVYTENPAELMAVADFELVLKILQDKQYNPEKPLLPQLVESILKCKQLKLHEKELTSLSPVMNVLSQPLLAVSSTSAISEVEALKRETEEAKSKAQEAHQKLIEHEKWRKEAELRHKITEQRHQETERMLKDLRAQVKKINPSPSDIAVGDGSQVQLLQHRQQALHGQASASGSEHQLESQGQRLRAVENLLVQVLEHTGISPLTVEEETAETEAQRIKLGLLL